MHAMVDVQYVVTQVPFAERAARCYYREQGTLNIIPPRSGHLHG